MPFRRCICVTLSHMYHDTHTNVAPAAADGDLFDEHDKFTRFLFQVQP